MLDDLSCLFGIGIEKFLDNDPEKFRDRLMSSNLSMTLLSVYVDSKSCKVIHVLNLFFIAVSAIVSFLP